jgi:acetyl esterase/lipase
MVMSQAESLGIFAATNGCQPTPQSITLTILVDDGTYVEEQTFAGCTSGAQVKAYVIHNGGHAWPPLESQLEAGGQATGNLDATALIVDFFLGGKNSSSLPTTVAYKTIPGIDPDLLSLDIHAPADAWKAPVVMWVHGGGYVTGDKANQMPNKVELFNRQDWILVSVNYRLSTPEGGAAQFPDHFLDVAAAVTWVWENIQAYGGDPHRIALLGHSAGADIVSNVAVNPIYLGEYGMHLSVLTCAAPLDTAGFDKVKAGNSEQEQWQNAFSNNPNHLTDTSASLLIQANIGIPPMLVVKRGSESRQQIATAFVDALQTAGIKTMLVDATSLTHEEVNSQIGAPGDTVMTEPLLSFLSGCFNE